VTFAAQSALATGFFMPADSRLAALQLESHRVTVDIRDQAAVTRVVEVFRNQHNRDLEATFVFPLPADAAVSEFKMYLNGDLVSGEILGKDRARNIYRQIVSRMKDPGLLEYMDNRLLKLSVFPVPAQGVQEVTVEYVQMLSAEDGLVHYTYPLKTPQSAARTMKDFTLTVEIASAAGLKNIYSPTHEVVVGRLDDNHATVGFEQSGVLLDRDFDLFYALSDAEFGATLLSCAGEDEDGYFLLLLSPGIEIDEDDIKPKDVTFVFDVSGSMSGEKIEQAKKALDFCVSRLHDVDRFRIIVFSNFTRFMSKELLRATADNRKAASDFISELTATGGTDINSALQEALAVSGDGGRAHMIVFLTDGIPTVGKIRVREIVGEVRRRNTASTRIFCFGVGNDVHTKLLDGLTRLTGSYTQYVRPHENIEASVSTFFKRVSDPLLSDIVVEYGEADVYDTYPARPADLYAGSQLLIAGRFRRPGKATLAMTASGPAQTEEFQFPVEFSEGSLMREFIPQIWAQRKVAFLLREIRLNGENKELKDEVIRLSKKHGIMTPYTSYLVVEKADRFARFVSRNGPRGRVVRGTPGQHSGLRTDDLYNSVYEERAHIGLAPPSARTGESGRDAAGRGLVVQQVRRGAPRRSEYISRTGVPSSTEREQAVMDRMMASDARFNRRLSGSLGRGGAGGAGGGRSTAGLGDAALVSKRTTGARAVRASQALNLALQNDKLLSDGLTKKVAGRTFVKLNDVWIETSVTEEHKAVTIRFGAAEYFEIYDGVPELAKVFALGEKLVFVAGKYAVVIDPDATADIEGAELSDILEALTPR
jgi:Ca-activated chloride channel family protein